MRCFRASIGVWVGVVLGGPSVAVAALDRHCPDEVLQQIVGTEQGKSMLASLKKYGITKLHGLFFPGMKVTPKPEWKTKLEALGDVAEFDVLRNGLKVRALEISPKSGKTSHTVVLAHPIGKRAKYFFAEGPRVQMYLDAGYNVVLYDFNGFGESDLIDFYYWRDTAAVVAAAAQRHPGGHLVLHGVSFGAFHVIRAVPLLPEGSSVVLENVSRSLYDYWKRWFVTGNVARLVQLARVPGFQDMHVLPVLKGLERPDLQITFIACTDDEFTPADEMRDLMAATQGVPTSLLTVSGAKHLQAPQKGGEAYRQAIRAGLRGRE